MNEGFVSAQLALRNDTTTTIDRLGARFAARDPKLQEMLRTIDDFDRQVSSLQPELTHALSAPQEKRTKAQIELKQKLIELETAQTEALNALKASYPDYAELTRPRALPIQEVQTHLLPQEALILIYPAYNETFIWAVTREGASWVHVDIGRNTLDLWVKELRDEIDSFGEVQPASFQSRHCTQPV